jgi:hypothetical protein
MKRLNPVICSSVIVGGHRQLLPGDEHLDQGRPVVLERLADHRSYLLRRFRGHAQETRGLGHPREMGIVQARAEIENAGGG